MAQADNIVEKYSGHMAAFFKQRLLEIEAEIDTVTAPLVKEREGIVDFLKTLQNKGTNGATIIGPAYSRGMSYIEKAIFFTSHDEWLTLNEIADKIIEKEPNLNKDNLKATLSAVLVMEIKKPPITARLVRKQNEDGKFVYTKKY